MNRFLIPDNFVEQADLKLRTASYQIPLNTLRVHDAIQTLLPTTSANDDLGLTAGTYGTNAPSVRTSDLKAAGATTRYARFLFCLPPEYVAGESVVLRAHAGMITTVADTTATLDASAYVSDEESGVGSDLVATAATTINSTTLADIDFTITATSLTPGQLLDVRLAMAINDAATGTAVIGTIGALSMRLGVRT